MGRTMIELLYDVTVRNELTSEVRVVRISSFGPADAQAEALVYVFKSHGWRKALALLPQELYLPSQVESVA
jgi:hypothetical protein